MGGEKSVNGVEIPPFECAEDGHQNGLSVGSGHATVALNYFAHDDRRPDFPLGMVVRRWNVGIFQKGQQFVPIFLQALGQPLNIAIVRWNQHKINQALIEPFDPGCISVR